MEGSRNEAIEQIEIPIDSEPIFSDFAVQHLKVFMNQINYFALRLLSFFLKAMDENSEQKATCELPNFELIMEQQIKGLFLICKNIFLKNNDVDQMNMFVENLQKIANFT